MEVERNEEEGRELEGDRWKEMKTDREGGRQTESK